MKFNQLENKYLTSNDEKPVLYAVSSDLYRTARKSDGGWEEEGICRNCAISIKDNPNSELKAYHDIHATFSFEAESMLMVM